MENGVTDPSAIEAFSKFLQYGPIGIAGLMLLLVIVSISIGSISAGKERILKTFMYVGAFCFVAALVAQAFVKTGEYPVDFVVAPNDFGEARVLPAPIIKVNGKVLDRDEVFLVKSRATAIVDVTDAIDFVRNAQREFQEQTAAFNDVIQQTEQLETAVAELQSSLTPATSSPELRRVVTATSTLNSAKTRAVTGMQGFSNQILP